MNPQELWRRGHIDGLLRIRRTLSDAVSQLNQLSFADEESGELDEAVLTRALSSFVHQLTGERARVREAVAPFLNEADELDEARLDRVVDAVSPTSGARLQTQIAAWCYRRAFDYPAVAARFAEQAVRRLKPPGRASEPFLGEHDRLVALYNAQLWSARIDWRSGYPEAALRRLEGLVDALTETAWNYEHEVVQEGTQLPTTWVGAFTSIEGQAHCLLASIEFARGNARARHKISRAILLLKYGGMFPPRMRSEVVPVPVASNSVHEAYGLFLSGKFESSFSKRRFRWAVRTTRYAEERFDEVSQSLLDGQPHPWRLRASVQLCQTLLKAGERCEAEEVLERIMRDSASILEDPQSPTHDLDELSRIVAELALARLWLAEQEARESPTEDNREKYKKAAEKIPEHGVPSRLRAERRLHRGRALAQLGAHEEAETEIRVALEIAGDGERRNIAAACHLALAELFGPIRPASAWASLEDYSQTVRLSDTGSSYLDDWARRVIATVNKGRSVTLDLSGRNLDGMKDALEEAYFVYNQRRAGRRQTAFSDLTGLDKNRYYRLKRKYEGDAGQPSKPVSGEAAGPVGTRRDRQEEKE